MLRCCSLFGWKNGWFELLFTLVHFLKVVHRNLLPISHMFVSKVVRTLDARAKQKEQCVEEWTLQKKECVTLYAQTKCHSFTCSSNCLCLKTDGNTSVAAVAAAAASWLREQEAQQFTESGSRSKCSSVWVMLMDSFSFLVCVCVKSNAKVSQPATALFTRIFISLDRRTSFFLFVSLLVERWWCAVSFSVFAGLPILLFALFLPFRFVPLPLYFVR